MAAIFVSHSSTDAEIAARVKAWLTDLGYEQTFLDTDCDTGIVAGENWERRLYFEIERCHAVVIVQTPAWDASKWCFAEYTNARAQGKKIFPLICAPGTQRLSELQATQLIDWAPARLEQVANQIRLITADLARGFKWPPGRPPYTGLASYEEDDAAIFFGRDEEVREVIAWMEARQNNGVGKRFLLIHGASGSGKSSLLKAALLPQLRRDKKRWVVLPTIRPKYDPVRTLAGGLAGLDSAGATDEDWHARIEGADALAQVAALLKSPRKSQDASVFVVLAIDQFEEAFLAVDRSQDEPGPPCDRQYFLTLLAELARADQNLPLLIVATARSDLIYGSFVTERYVVDHRAYLLPPMPLSRISRLITEPAKIASLALEPGLAECIVGDVRDPGQLPLLAFTLRDLYDHSPGQQMLTLAGYNDLGNSAVHLDPIANAVGRRAEEMIADLEPSLDDIERLRNAFIPHLVRLRGVENIWVRHSARRSDLPPESLPLIGKFINARLLTERSGLAGSSIEVAHEALFTAWPRLVGWLAEETDFLADLDRLWDAYRIWIQASDGDRPETLLNPFLLARGRYWLERHSQRFERGDLRQLTDFIAASAEAFDAASADRVTREARATRWRRRAVVVSVLVAIIAGTSALMLWRSDRAQLRATARAQEETSLAETNQASALAALSTVILPTSPVEALKLALAATPATHDEGVLARVADALSAALLQMRERHVLQVAEGQVVDAMFSPDGRWVVTAATDGTARLYDAWSGASLKTFASPDQQPLVSARFGPTGQLVVTASSDGIARIWDLATGHDRPSTQADSRSLTIARFSPNGDRIVTASSDGYAKVWDTWGHLIRTFAPDDGPIQSAVFSPDNKRVATISSRRGVMVWDVAHGVGKVMDPRDQTAASTIDDLPHGDLVAFSPDGNKLAAVSNDNAARVWDLSGDVPPRVLQQKGTVRSVAFSNDSSHLVTGSDDGTAVVWDLTSGTSAKLVGHDGFVLMAAFSPDGSRVVTGSWDKTARIWDAATGTEIATLRGHGRAVRTVAFSPDGRLVATGSSDATARLWDISTLSPLATFRSAPATTNRAALSPDGGHVLTADSDGVARIWSGLSSEGPWRLATGGRTVFTAVYSQDGRQIFTGSDAGGIIWNAGSHQKIGDLKETDPVRGAAFSPDGKRIVTTSNGANIYVWKADTGRSVHVFAPGGTAISVAYSADGARIAAGFTDGTVKIVDGETGQVLQTLRGHRFPVLDVAFSPTGNRVVSASRDRQAILWNAQKGTCLGRLGHDREVNGAVVSQDGSRIVTVSNDRQIRVWDTATAREIVSFGLQPEPVRSAAISTDGRRLATATASGARVWDISQIPSGNISQIACSWLPDTGLSDLRNLGGAAQKPICQEAFPAGPDAHGSSIATLTCK